MIHLQSFNAGNQHIFMFFKSIWYIVLFRYFLGIFASHAFEIFLCLVASVVGYRYALVCYMTIGGACLYGEFYPPSRPNSISEVQNCYKKTELRVILIILYAPVKPLLTIFLWIYIQKTISLSRNSSASLLGYLLRVQYIASLYDC